MLLSKISRDIKVKYYTLTKTDSTCSLLDESNVQNVVLIYSPSEGKRNFLAL